MSGTSAEQFALMGAVFLVLGAAFVFAPQIVSAVNGFFGRLFGRAKKHTAPHVDAQPAGAEPAAPASPVTGQAVDIAPSPEELEREWGGGEQEPKPAAPAPAEGSAIARLRREIGESWKSER